MDDLAITCDEINEETNFNEYIAICKSQNFTLIFINYDSIIDRS